jgi:hypothetical protein
MSQQYVILECIKEGSKLRVKMKSPGYLINSNCQFPRDLRIEGRKFKVPVEHVKLMTQNGKYFYSIKNKSAITIIDDDEHTTLNMENIKKNTTIYQDADNNDCAVCLCAIKDTVFIPCGHFYTCDTCSNALKTCPICRMNITNKVNKTLFE